MSSDDIQRVIGGILANLETLQKKTARLETGFIAIGTSAFGIIVVYILKQAGLM